MLYLSNQMYQALEKTSCMHDADQSPQLLQEETSSQTAILMYERGFHHYMLHDHQTKHTTDNNWPESHRLHTAYACRRLQTEQKCVAMLNGSSQALEQC